MNVDTYPAIATRGRGDAAALGEAWRKLLLTVHVAAAVALLGADLVLLVLALVGAGGADARSVYPAAALVGARVMAPLAVLALGTGVVLGSLTRWGLLRHGWVTTNLAITTVLAGVLLFVLVPCLGDAAAAALTPAGVPAAARLRFAVGPAVSSVLLLVNVALGVYKPRRRARRGSAA